jgi:HSP20 family protein
VFDQLQDEINRLFDFEWPREHTGLLDRNTAPAIDISEHGGVYEVRCDLPGVDKKDLDISIASNVLTIKGEKSAEKESKNRKYYRRESWTGSFQRSISLPAGVDPEKIGAEMKNGVLTVTLPKKDEVKPKQIAINVK